MVSNKAMYNELGITAAAAENLSEMTTSLAYDFGNAFSMDDSEALSLIQSAIGGSTDALNEYGIVLDKTALKNSAAALGLGTNIDALEDVYKRQGLAQLHQTEFPAWKSGMEECSVPDWK